MDYQWRHAWLPVCLVLFVSCGGSGGSSTDAGMDGDGGGNPAEVATIVVSPTMASVMVGSTQQFTAEARNESGSRVSGVTVTWTSDNPAAASIDSTGLATGVAQGSARIFASVAQVTSEGAVLNVVEAPKEPLVIVSGDPDPPTAGSAYSFQFEAAGGTLPYTWEATILAPDQASGGLSLDGSTGLLSGTPAYSGSLPFTVTVRGADWRYTSVQYDLHISGAGSPRQITNSPPDGMVGESYAFRFSTSWSSELGCDPSLLLINGSLPPGLTLNTLSGDLGEPPNASGTPIAAGSYTFTVSAWTNEYCIDPPLETNAHTFTIDISGGGFAPPGASGWNRSGTPVLEPLPGTWEGDGLRSPSIVKVDSTYYLYYEARSPIDHTTRIGLATSTDGQTFTRAGGNPVLQPGTPGSWDGFEIRYPTVHHDGSTFRLWYWGKSDLDANQVQSAAMIGLATSTDGIHFEKHTEPVFGKEYGGQGLIPGSVLLLGQEFVMWYATAFGDIGRASSPDGIDWTDAGEVLENASGRPSVVQDEGTFRMWLTRRNSFGGGIVSGSDLYNVNIASATSPDGSNWTLLEQNPSLCFFCKTTDDWVPALAMGPEGAFDRPGVGEPTVIKDGAVFRMWYVGGNINRPGFGSLNDRPYVNGSIGAAQSPAGQ